MTTSNATSKCSKKPGEYCRVHNPAPTDGIPTREAFRKHFELSDDTSSSMSTPLTTQSAGSMTKALPKAGAYIGEGIPEALSDSDFPERYSNRILGVNYVAQKTGEILEDGLPVYDIRTEGSGTIIGQFDPKNPSPNLINREIKKQVVYHLQRVYKDVRFIEAKIHGGGGAVHAMRDNEVERLSMQVGKMGMYGRPVCKSADSGFRFMRPVRADNDIPNPGDGTHPSEGKNFDVHDGANCYDCAKFVDTVQPQ
jgi:hypothetical protein